MRSTVSATDASNASVAGEPRAKGTPADGDTIFALATGERQGEPNVLLVGALAADVMSEAIVRAALSATASGGLPAARDFGSAPRR